MTSNPKMQHLARIYAEHFGSPEEQEAVKRLALERKAAETEMAYQYANLHMPEDIRSRAKVWGMEAFCEVLWNNAFQSGWRESRRALIAQGEGK